jgi:hypothetical protein
MRSGNFPRVIKAGESIIGGDKEAFKYSWWASEDEIREPGKCREQI